MSLALLHRLAVQHVLSAAARLAKDRYAVAPLILLDALNTFGLPNEYPGLKLYYDAGDSGLLEQHARDFLEQSLEQSRDDEKLVHDFGATRKIAGAKDAAACRLKAAGKGRLGLRTCSISYCEAVIGAHVLLEILIYRL